MTETEAAYVAGLIDGEGSIRLFDVKQYRSDGALYTAAHLRLQIGMTDEPMIRWLHQLTGNGNIEIYKRPPTHPTWKPCFRITWSTGSAGPLLKKVMPYLRLKKRHAEIALEWIDLSKDMRTHVGGRGRHDRVIPVPIREKRNLLLAEIKSLNRRGQQLPSEKLLVNGGN